MHEDGLHGHKLIKGTAILTVSGIVVRAIGMFNRMILSRWIGAEGLGLVQLIIPVYALMAAIISFGLPGAVTKLTAERYALGDHKGKNKIKRIAFRAVLAFSMAAVLLYWLIIFTSGEKLLPDSRIIFPLKIAPLGFLFAGFSQIIRSYFQGLGDMVPTATSQLVEQIARFSLGLLGVFLFLPYGLGHAIIGLVLGIMGGEFLGFFCLLVYYRKEGRSSPVSSSTSTDLKPESLRLLKDMFSMALPLLVIRISGSLTHATESLLLPSRLQEAGFSSEEAVSLFGQLSGMAVPLLFLPTVLILPFNSALVPYIARTKILKQKESLRKTINFSLGGTLSLGLISALLLYYSSPWLTSILYGSLSASTLVSMLSWIAPFAYIQFTAAAILHGLGRPGIAVANDFLGTLLALFLIYFLTANPSIGIQGAVWAYSAGYILTSLLDCIVIKNITRNI